MSAFLPTLLAWLQEFGYPVLWLCACVSAFGLPIPTILLLLAAGAFAALGDFNIFLLILIAFSASVCGDNLGYLLGHKVGARFLDWLARQRRVRFLSPKRIEQAQQYFGKYGAWAIFLSRFLILALGGIINLLAGTERYSYRRFLLYDIFGELLGALIPLLLGYLFSASWEMIGNIIGLISLIALSLIVALILLVHLVRLLRQSSQAQQAVKQPVTQKKTVGVNTLQFPPQSHSSNVLPEEPPL